MPLSRQSVEPWLGLSTTVTLPTRASHGARVSPEVLAAVLYATCRYLLRAILAGVDGSKGDIIDAVLLTAIMDADIGHLDEIATLGWRYATYADGPPDGFRRPISVRLLSDRLGLPYETTRRRVDGLIAMGRCVRTEHGVHARLIDEPHHHAGSQANYAAVRTLLRDLSSRVPEVYWPKADASDLGAGEPPLRLVNRRCAAFAVDTLARIADMAGGYDEALVYMGMVEATGRGAAGDAWPTLRTSSLARSLSQPIPSVRRRLHTLRTRGLITARGASFDARPAPQAEAVVSRLAVANLKRLQVLFAQLQSLDVGLGHERVQRPEDCAAQPAGYVG